jgi:hypothetical protein
LGLAIIIVLSRIVTILAGENIWSTEGPVGGRIIDVAVSRLSHDLVFIGTIENGVYKSTDAGQNWQHIPRGILGRSFRVVIPHPEYESVILASTAQGVFKTENSWGGVDTISVSLGVGKRISRLCDESNRF